MLPPACPLHNTVAIILLHKTLTNNQTTFVQSQGRIFGENSQIKLDFESISPTKATPQKHMISSLSLAIGRPSLVDILVVPNERHR